MKTCRGIDASLTEEKIQEFGTEHLQLLHTIASDLFTVRHYIAAAVLQIQ